MGFSKERGRPIVAALANHFYRKTRVAVPQLSLSEQGDGLRTSVYGYAAAGQKNLAAGMALFGPGWEATLAACSPPPAQSMQALAWPRLLERLALWQVLGLRA